MLGLSFTYWTDANATAALVIQMQWHTGVLTISRPLQHPVVQIVKPVLVTINTGPAPTVKVTDPATVCEPSTVDLTNPDITAGSDAGLNYTYWTDAANTVPLPNPNAVGQSGTYYITGTATGGCSSTMSVQVACESEQSNTGINPSNCYDGTKYLSAAWRQRPGCWLHLSVVPTCGNQFQ